MATNVRDPRRIITPDAFELATELLGTPLASPWRRLWALLIDIVVIGVLTAVTASISLILWGGVALFLITMAFRSPGHQLGQVTSILFRGATGCLGAVILLGVLIGYLALRAGDDFTVDEVTRGVAEALQEGSAAESAAGPSAGSGDEGPGLVALLRGLSGIATLDRIDDPVEAERILTSALLSLPDEAVTARDARALLDQIVPDDVPWAEQRDSVFARAIAAADLDPGAPEAGAGEAESDPSAAEGATPESADPAAVVAGLDDAEVLQRFADLRSRVTDSTALEGRDAELHDLLRNRLTLALAADTLDALADRLDDAEDDLDRSERQLAEVRSRLEAGGDGFRGLLRDIWDQAGSAIGLWSVYFTVALTLTNGRTIGKKLLGLRVLRLDGESLNWWASFERAGGYVAGIATGTLGFVQVFWDANRQCVHDKIVGTVVVVDGAEIEPGAWQEAWADSEPLAEPTGPAATDRRGSPGSGEPVPPDDVPPPSGPSKVR